MLLRALARVTFVAALFSAAVGCGDDVPRMHVVKPQVEAGALVVAHVESRSHLRTRGELWLTLAPAGSPDSFVGERVMLDDAATRVALSARAPGPFEVRLHDDFPRRPHHVIGRARVDIVEPAVARRDPPRWYW